MKLSPINTLGLSMKTHSFSFSLGADFLPIYSGSGAPEGVFNAVVELTKKETFIEASFDIGGKLTLTCDRSLREFDYPIAIKKKIIFKYGEEAKELSDDIMLIDRKNPNLEVGQLIYELIGLAIPIKKLHPDFLSQDIDSTDNELIYSTSTDEAESKKKMNPIWEKLVPPHKD